MQRVADVLREAQGSRRARWDLHAWKIKNGDLAPGALVRLALRVASAGPCGEMV